MIDYHSWSPLVMTNYETFAFYSMLTGLGLTALRDIWSNRRKGSIR